MSSSVKASRACAGGTATAPALTAVALLVMGVTVHGCSSGSGGSDVGGHTPTAPTARLEVLNGGPTAMFREGAEVLLTGKASEDADGPLIAWSWRQTSGVSVRLLEANSTTIKFTAPHVELPTALAFELTVEDSTGNLGHASTDVIVLPARDTDKFLSFDVARGASFDTFEVVAALAGGAVTGSAPRPFTFSAEAYLVYPSRDSPNADCSFDSADFAGGIPARTASGCLVEWLENLTPAPLPSGGTGLAGAWPADVVAPNEPDATRVARWWNTRFVLRVPRLDVPAFNQRFVEGGARNRIVDGFAAHDARIVLSFSLSAPHNQQQATLVFPGLVHAPIPLPAQTFAGGPPLAASSIANAGVGLPTAAVVPLDTLLAAIEGREAALTSAVYYRTVDRTGTRTSLSDWLRQAGFTDAAGQLLPAAVAGTGEFARAVYVNNFDLGFGRQMYTRTDSLGNVFSFVKNYSTLEGAIRQLDSFATVVTEYSPLVNHTDSTAKFVKFFTFVEDGSGDAPRVTSFDFDGRGERFTPGNCVVCHGGQRPPGVSELLFDSTCGDPNDAVCYAWPAFNRDGVAIADGDLAGTFLPWDIGSLLFADTDPAITRAPVPFDGVTLQAELLRDYGDFSRNRQLAQLKKLNQAAYRTYTARNDAARRLVESWYGGVDANGTLVSDVFDDSASLPGWRNGEVVPDPSPASRGGSLTNPPTTEDLYHGVYARHCRMCHTNMPDGPLRFDTYQELVFQRDALRQTVFRAGTMPGARLTMDRFWVPFDGGVPPGEVFAGHLANLYGEPPAPPGAAIADIVGLELPPNRGDTVYLDGGNSVFAHAYSWSLVAPAGSTAAFTDPHAGRTAFVADVPGTYEVALVVNGESAAPAVVRKTVTIPNRMPVAANDLFGLDLTATSVVQGSLLAGAQQDFDLDGDTLTAMLAVGGAPSHGTVTVDAAGAFSYAYAGASPTPPSDTFRYTIADGFGGTAQGTVTILLNGAAVGVRPAAVPSLTAVDASTAAGAASVSRVQLSWLASSDDVLGYNVYRDGALLGFVASSAPPGTAVVYTDVAVSPSRTHAYRVTALDAGNESSLSEERLVAVAPSLRRNVQTGWGVGTDSLWQVAGCVGCHRGTAGGLTLFGAPDLVITELNEDATDVEPRRLERAAPQRSLLLCKTLVKSDPNSCPHEGGALLVSSDPRFRVLLRWVEENAPNN